MADWVIFFAGLAAGTVGTLAGVMITIHDWPWRR